MPVFVVDSPQTSRQFTSWVNKCEGLTSVTAVATEPPTVSGTIGSNSVTLALMLDEGSEMYTDCDLVGQHASGANPRQAIGRAIQEFMNAARDARKAWLQITAT